MSAPERNEDLLIDLLIKEATEGLSVDESATLRDLAQAFPQLEASAIEQTVAALCVAMLADSEGPPEALRERILAAAGAPTTNPIRNTATISGLDKVRIRADEARDRRPRWSSAGWWVAAASLLLALAGWWPRLLPQDTPLIVAKSPAEVRAELLASGHAIRASWSPVAADGSQPLVGDVVFDPVTQRGFLTFRGIPANDPRLAQYQLWIVDARRKQPEPIDGGIFDVASESQSGGVTSSNIREVVIPFEARLPVGQPAAFVVTLEQPGGVVISKQERVLALAKVGST